MTTRSRMHQEERDRQLAQSLSSRFSFLKSKRDKATSLRKEIFDLVCPYRHEDFVKDKRCDTTATDACDKLASVLQNLITPFGSRWHGLVAPDKRTGYFVADEENKNLREACERMVQELFAQREVYKSGFNLCLKEFYTEVVLFGMGCFYVCGRDGGGLSYRSVPVDSIVCAVNHENVIDTVFEEYKMTAENALKKWGEGKLSDKMKEDLSKPDSEEYTFFQAVFPKVSSPFYHDEPSSGYRSVVVCKDENLIMEEGQYKVMPYIIGRYEACPSKPYGFSPVVKALGAIRRLNELSYSISLYSDLTLNPPVNAPEELKGSTFHRKPKAINYGFSDRSGRPLVSKLDVGDGRPSHEELHRLRSQIRDIFMLDLFQVFADRASRSAAESMEKTREKGVFISAIVGGLQAEFVGSMVERELDVLLGQKGKNREELKGVKIYHTSPLYKYLRAEEVSGNLQGMRALGELANITGDPTLIAMIDSYKGGYDTLRGMGVSECILLSEEDTNTKIENMRKASEAQEQRRMAFEQQVKSGGKIAESRAEEQII